MAKDKQDKVEKVPEGSSEEGTSREGDVAEDVTTEEWDPNFPRYVRTSSGPDGSTVIEGVWVRRTGDIGMLTSNPAWLSIGSAMRWYGLLRGVNYTHMMFSRDMVPMLTSVSIVFQRLLTGTKTDHEAFTSSASRARLMEGDYFEPPKKETASSGGGGGGKSGNAPSENISDTKGVKIYEKPKGMKDEEYIWRILRSNGYSEEQTAGIMGNIRQESGYDPKIVQSNGVGHGIVQWSKDDRWAELEKWAKKHDKTTTDIETQCEYMMKEMKEGWGGFSDSTMRKKKSIRDACVYFHDEYEKSADSADFVWRQRGGFAEDAFKKWKGTEVWTEGGPGDTDVGSGDGKEWFPGAQKITTSRKNPMSKNNKTRKAVFHWTAGPRSQTAEQIARYVIGKGSEYSIIVDDKGDVVQIYPGSTGARSCLSGSLANYSVGGGVNRCGTICIQVCAIGDNGQKFSAAQRKSLVAVAQWIKDSWGVPAVAVGKGSGNRDKGVWTNKSGWVSHAEAPGNDHTDHPTSWDFLKGVK